MTYAVVVNDKKKTDSTCDIKEENAEAGRSRNHHEYAQGPPAANSGEKIQQ